MILVHAEAERSIRNAVVRMHNLQRPEDCSRPDYAVKLFKSGFNCAQSVFAAYADLFGLDFETSLKMSGALGGGVGRMREVCGAVLSMSLVAGLKEGNANPEDEEAKAHIYELVRKMSDMFRERQGSIICREILGIEGMEESSRPSIRTPEFYSSRPCAGIIKCAAQIIDEVLFSKE